MGTITTPARIFQTGLRPPQVEVGDASKSKYVHFSDLADAMHHRP